MKWKSHAAITRSVGDALALSPGLVEVMVEASLEPDRCPIGRRDKVSGHFTRSRHHHSDAHIIRVLIWKARMAFIGGDLHGGSRALGLALHYVQDRSVPRGRSWRYHKDWETKLTRYPVPQRALEVGLSLSMPCPSFVDTCIASIRPRKDKGRAMYQATACSAALARTVLDKLTAPSGMAMSIARLMTFYRRCSFIILIGLGGTMFAFLIIGPMVISLLPFVVALWFWVHKKNRHLIRLAKWYGIDLS
jgi:hypothetical protein